MKRKQFLYHILFWAGIYLLWVAIFRTYSFTLSKTMTVEFCYLIFITADFYAINNLIVPHFLIKKKYALFVSATILIIVLSAWLRALVAVQMNVQFFHSIPVDFCTLFINSAINISLWVLLVTTAKMLIDKIQTQQQLELVKKEITKNELDYLKAQINPHAFFNSLNTIYGHIDKDNQVARNILLQFSELLRYQLYECGAEKVSLEKEMEYIKNYIAFQRLRKDERLIVEVDLTLNEPGLMIAPLMLVVLVENTFKFVSNFSDKENKIRIKIDASGQVLHSYFSNTKEISQNASNRDTGGIGITNLRRRLELLYPLKYEFKTNIENELYETNLIINLG